MIDMSYATYEKYKTGVHHSINTHLHYKSDPNWSGIGIFQRKKSFEIYRVYLEFFNEIGFDDYIFTFKKAD